MKSLYVSFPQANQVTLEQEDVSPPREGEVLCQALKSLISIGTETLCLRGVFDPGTNWASWVKYPFRPGYSMVARVVGVGPGVSGCQEGDRLMVWTGHQQFFKTRMQGVDLLPIGVSDEEATWGALAITTQLAVRRAELALGETVGVVGLGMLGQLIVQYLRVAGARKIIAIDSVPSRLEIAQAHGATYVLRCTAQEARPLIEEITQGKLLDAVWDVTGHPAALAPCVQLLRKRGRVILVGDTPTSTQQYLGPGVVSNSIAILGVHGTSSAAQYSEFTPWTRREMASLFYDYILQKRMRVADLVTHRHSPIEAPQVYARLMRDRADSLGVLFDWALI